MLAAEGRKSSSRTLDSGSNRETEETLLDACLIRERQYDPTIGRFISEDPIRFGAGDANLYRYVWNNPVNNVDPSGHDSPRRDEVIGAEWTDANGNRVREVAQVYAPFMTAVTPDDWYNPSEGQEILRLGAKNGIFSERIIEKFGVHGWSPYEKKVYRFTGERNEDALTTPVGPDGWQLAETVFVAPPPPQAPALRQSIASETVEGARAQDVPQKVYLPWKSVEFVVYSYTDEEWADRRIHVGDYVDLNGQKYQAVNVVESEAAATAVAGNTANVVNFVTSLTTSKTIYGHEVFHSRQETNDVTFKLSYGNYRGIDPSMTDAADNAFLSSFSNANWAKAAGNMQKENASFYAEIFGTSALVAFIGGVIYLRSAAKEARAQTAAAGHPDDVLASEKNPNAGGKQSATDRMKPGKQMKFWDDAAQTDLASEGLTPGMKKLKQAGLTAVPQPDGSWDFVDGGQRVRARWVPKKGQEPPHWSKFEPTGNQKHYLDNSGRPVDGSDPSHRIPSR